jgi:hypothetical protein
MMKTLRWAFVPFAVVGIASSSDAFVYDASLLTLPTQQGWSLHETGASSPPPFLSGASLHMGPKAVGGVQAYRRNDMALNFTMGFAMIGVVRIINSDLYLQGGNRRAGYYLFAGDQNGRQIAVGITNDRVFLGTDASQNQVPAYMMDTTSGFNTYHVRSHGNTVTLAVNGIDRITANLGATNLTMANYAWFGGVSSVTAQESLTNYVGYTMVPEPATMAALGLGALVLAKRRRRK